MKKILVLFFVLFGLLNISPAQDVVSLRFTGLDSNNNYVRLTNVVIVNASCGWSEVIYYPDTVLNMNVSTGIEELTEDGFGILKVRPNPFDKVTQVELAMPQSGKVHMEVMTIGGENVIAFEDNLDKGVFVYELSLQKAQTYVLKATSEFGVSSVKIVNTGSAADNNLSRVGIVQTTDSDVLLKSTTSNPFYLGNVLSYTGYATVGNQSYTSNVITQNQTASEDITLIFPSGMGANVVPTVLTSSVSYNTVTTNSAICGGNVISDGGLTVTARGVCWSTSSYPTTSDEKTVDGGGIGIFTSNITGLLANTMYYVRAYATNDLGTSYGAHQAFITRPYTYTVTYNANGGSGTMSSQTFVQGEIEALTANTFTRAGYTFVGWNTQSDGSGISYTDQQNVTLFANMTLYAQWEQ